MCHSDTRDIDDYNLGYFEGVRNVANIYQKCLDKIAVNYDPSVVELRLNSELFVSLLVHELEEARDLTITNRGDQ